MAKFQTPPRVDTGAASKSSRKRRKRGVSFTLLLNSGQRQLVSCPLIFQRVMLLKHYHPWASFTHIRPVQLWESHSFLLVLILVFQNKFRGTIAWTRKAVRALKDRKEGRNPHSECREQMGLRGEGGGVLPRVGSVSWRQGNEERVIMQFSSEPIPHRHHIHKRL